MNKLSFVCRGGERERDEVRKFECVFVKENKRLNENEKVCVPKGGDEGRVSACERVCARMLA